jgi:hypothetical protein
MLPFGAPGMLAILLLAGIQILGGALRAIFKPIGMALLHITTRPASIVCPKLAKAITYYINRRRDNIEVTTDKYCDDGTIIRQDVQKYAGGLSVYGCIPFYVSSPSGEGGNEKEQKRQPEGAMMVLYFPKLFYSRKRIKEFVDHCREEYEIYAKVAIKNKIDCYEWSSEGYAWRFIDNIPCRPESSVAGKMHKQVLAAIRRYVDARRNYMGLHIPLKQTILLHGPPGTGKTMIAFLAASVFGMSLFKMSLKDTKLNNDMLRNASRIVTPGSIVLFDEFRYDTLEAIGGGKKRLVQDDVGNIKIEGINKLDITCILEDLDGGPKANRITIIITNHYRELITALGKAFMRDGRIDNVFEIGFAVHEDIVEYYIVTMNILIKPDSSSQDACHKRAGDKTVPGNEWRRIRDAAKADDAAMPLNDRIIGSPMTPATVMYDLLIYLRTKNRMEAQHLCSIIRDETCVDLLPLCATPVTHLPGKIRELQERNLDIHRVIRALSREFADRIVDLSDCVTMAKLQTVLIKSLYSPVLMLDNCQVVIERDRITDIQSVDIDPTDDCKEAGVKPDIVVPECDREPSVSC